ncbi:hypothetical protein [Magnetospirillum sp. UT-4]|uniref:hypothetical protein n=1 Tax=Magnetospirillum sp. UT-4 TaxID=2681467 RepID=UPI0015721AD7|nr:hypothetical protein [Magnetospirillum sp. UT-4]
MCSRNRLTGRLATLLVLLLAALPARAMDKPRDWVPPAPESVPNHRELWRKVVIGLAEYAKTRRPDFIVLVRNGVELAVKGEREARWEDIQDPAGSTFEKRLPLGAVFRPYLKVIDGMVVDGLYCSDDAFGKPLAEAIKDRRELDAIIAREKARGIQRPPVPQPVGPFSIDPAVELARAAEVRRQIERAERQRRQVYAFDALRAAGRSLFAIESCRDQKAAGAAYKDAARDRVVAFATTQEAGLDRLPPGRPWGENADPVVSVGTVRNWLPMLKGDRFGSKGEWVIALSKQNHDMLVIDPTWRGAEPLTKEEVLRLKYKNLGAPRPVVAALSLGKAADTRWYWQKGWEAGNPPFLFAPDSDQPGRFITDVDDPKWKEALGKFLIWIMDLGFDGVMFDDLDTYLWFEELMPLDG